jgi:hypothetical protein
MATIAFSSWFLLLYLCAAFSSIFFHAAEYFGQRIGFCEVVRIGYMTARAKRRRRRSNQTGQFAGGQGQLCARSIKSCVSDLLDEIPLSYSFVRKMQQKWNF